MKQKKNQKPTKVEANFRYLCPNPDCGLIHWISLKEAKTKNFKIVCDCDTIFQPKQISKIKIIYKKYDDKKTIDNTTQPLPIIEKTKISIDLLNKCVTILIGYGFTETESIRVINKAFDENQITDHKLLIKYILSHIGELLNESTKAPDIV